MVHFHLQHWNHATEISATNFYNKKKTFAMSTVEKSYRSWASSYVFMHFANPYKKFQWKQSRRLVGTCQCLSSRLSGLIFPITTQSPNVPRWFTDVQYPLGAWTGSMLPLMFINTLIKIMYQAPFTWILEDLYATSIWVLMPHCHFEAVPSIHWLDLNIAGAIRVWNAFI